MQHVVDAGGNQTDGIDGAVVVEVLVLDRDRCVAQVPRDLVERDDGAALLVALIQQGHAVAGVDPGGLRQALRAEVIEARQLAGVAVEQRPRPSQDDQQPGTGHQEDPPQPVLRFALGEGGPAGPRERRFSAMRAFEAFWGGGPGKTGAAPSPRRWRRSHGAPMKRGHAAEGYPDVAPSARSDVSSKADNASHLHS